MYTESFSLWLLLLLLLLLLISAYGHSKRLIDLRLVSNLPFLWSFFFSFVLERGEVISINLVY